VLFHQIFQVLIDGGAVLGIFVILLINNKGVRKSRANLFLSILLGALTFSVFHSHYASEVIRLLSGHPYFVGDPTILVIAPLLWFYTVELTGGRIRFNASTILQFLPFFFICFCSISFQYISPESQFIRFLDQHPRVVLAAFWLIVVIQFSWYATLIHRKWLSYQQLIRQEVSNPEGVNISWIRFFTMMFLAVTIFMLFALFAVIHMNYGEWLWQTVGIVFSLSIFALGYRGILQKEIFYNEVVTSDIKAPATEQKPFTDRQSLDRLAQFMVKNRPFLDPDLSLSSLSKAMDLGRGQLSQLINEGAGENFYDFINKYRVEEVKRLMADPKMQHYNLLGVALEAGFKSKSTFNLTFKRFTGLTPTEYRKNITQQDVQ
jgi:AraC-like DNA-binding protein